MPLYLPILKTAWRTALRKRRLWWYALFAGLLIGSGIGNALTQVVGADPTRGAIAAIVNQIAEPISQPALLWAQARATGTGATIALVAYGLFLSGLLALILWLAVMGMNALVLAAERTARSTDIPTDLRQRVRRPFWSTLGIHVVMKAATATLLTIWGVVLATVASNRTTGATAGGVVAFTITVLLLTIIHLATPYAIASAVLDRRRTWSALRDAFALLRERWLITMEASILLTLANIAGVAAWLAGSFLLALPFLFLGGIAITKGATTLFTIAIIGGIVTLLAYLTVIAMCFTTFLATAWTLLYLRLTGPGEEPEPWITRATRRT